VANILTAEEAARVVAVDPADEKLADVLPQIDAYIKQATGRDWTQDTAIRPEAKAAARLQLALVYDLMAMQPSQIASLRAGLVSSLAQLETIASYLQVIENINAAAYVADMETYISSGKLGLNLIDYNRMRPNAQQSVAQAVLDERPLGGYADLSAIQAALDAAVKAAT